MNYSADTNFPKQLRQYKQTPHMCKVLKPNNLIKAKNYNFFSNKFYFALLIFLPGRSAAHFPAAYRTFFKLLSHPRIYIITFTVASGLPRVNFATADFFVLCVYRKRRGDLHTVPVKATASTPTNNRLRDACLYAKSKCLTTSK